MVSPPGFSMLIFRLVVPLVLCFSGIPHRSTLCFHIRLCRSHGIFAVFRPLQYQLLVSTPLIHSCRLFGEIRSIGWLPLRVGSPCRLDWLRLWQSRQGALVGTHRRCCFVTCISSSANTFAISPPSGPSCPINIPLGTRALFSACPGGIPCSR